MMVEQFDALMERAESLPYGDTKVSLLEEAVRLADTYQDTERGYYARMKLTDAAIHSGKAEKAFLTFGWCLAQYDKDPMKYDSHMLLWHYKWIAGHLDLFPEISSEQIETMLEDLKKRYAEMGYSNRVYHQIKYTIAWRRGYFEMAEQEFARWMEESRDSISDCAACELNQQVSYLLEKGQVAEALQTARPIFDGQLSCHSVPHSTYAFFLLPLLEEGRWEEAASFHEKGYRLIDNKQDFLLYHAEHLKYLTIVDPDRAMSGLEKSLPEALASREPYTRFVYFLSAALLLSELDERARDVLRIPDYVTKEWLLDQIHELAAQFDQRNGNSHFSERIQNERKQIADLKERYCQKNQKPESDEVIDAELVFPSMEEDLEMLMQKAKENDPDSMFLYSQHLLNKEGDPELQAKGEQWLRRAAEAGQLDALYVLAEHLLNLARTPEELEEGENMLKEAAETGHPRAMNDLGYRLLFGIRISPDPEQGRLWLHRSAEAGSTDGMLRYGLCLMQGLGGPQDTAESEHWIRRAAEEGNVVAMHVLGIHLLDGDIFPTRKDEGENWLRKAAEKEYLPAMHQLGSRLITGDQIEAHPSEGHQWLKKATEADYGPAMHELAYRLLEGEGLEPDRLQGEVLLRRAALLGEEGAMLELAGRLLNGDGLAEQWGEGFHWLRKAAEREHPDAMFILACYLLDYPQQARYEDEAIEWLRKAAENGHEKACSLLRELEENTGE